MRVFLLICFICFSTLTVTATEASMYVTKQYQSTEKSYIRINVKREYSQQIFLCIGSKHISKIIYGYGDMKSKRCKKRHISYICLIDEKDNIVDGWLICQTNNKILKDFFIK